MKTLDCCATMRRRLTIILLALTIGAVGAAAPQPSRGFDPATMDTTGSPCADFYQYAVGAT